MSVRKRVVDDLEEALAEVESGISTVEYAIQNAGDEIEDLEDQVEKLEQRLAASEPNELLRVLKNIRLYVDDTIKAQLEKTDGVEDASATDGN